MSVEGWDAVIIYGFNLFPLHVGIQKFFEGVIVVKGYTDNQLEYNNIKASLAPGCDKGSKILLCIVVS